MTVGGELVDRLGVPEAQRLEGAAVMAARGLPVTDHTIEADLDGVDGPLRHAAVGHAQPHHVTDRGRRQGVGGDEILPCRQELVPHRLQWGAEVFGVRSKDVESGDRSDDPRPPVDLVRVRRRWVIVQELHRVLKRPPGIRLAEMVRADVELHVHILAGDRTSSHRVQSRGRPHADVPRSVA